MASVERTEDRSTTGQREPALAEVAVRPGPPARFDRIARLYRPMEYLSFGPLLERCRFHHIPALTNCRRALVFGDGDGRFLARMLAAAPHLRADAVDGSSAMLHLLRERVALQGDRNRLTLTCADARIFKPHSAAYDLVVTHFFLDCLSERETHRLIARVRPHLAPGARWLVSEFQIPNAGALQRGLARSVISGLYVAFRLLTGLAVRRIPGWPAILARQGFRRKSTRSWLGGLLISELWEMSGATAPVAQPSHGEVISPAEPDILFSSIPGIDPGPEPFPDPPPAPRPDPAPGPAPEPDPEPYPGPIPMPQPVTRSGSIPCRQIP